MVRIDNYVGVCFAVRIKKKNGTILKEQFFKKYGHKFYL